MLNRVLIEKGGGEEDEKIKFMKVTDEGNGRDAVGGEEEEGCGLSCDAYVEWMRRMEDRVNEKRMEFQSVSVVMMI